MLDERKRKQIAAVLVAMRKNPKVAEAMRLALTTLDAELQASLREILPVMPTDAPDRDRERNFVELIQAVYVRPEVP